jgi:putative 4-mercaptohistidine N1-methyltranferase
MNLYETTRLVDEYLLFHYGSAAELLPHPGGPEEALFFPLRTVVENLPAGPMVGRALDIGCAVGRSSFALSALASEVVGIDYSHAFIAAAQALQRGETLPYRLHEEGAVYTTLTAQRPADAAFPERIQFQQGDATALPESLGAFDIVHAANLICRLPEPQAFLARLPSLVAPHGTLVITTPCTWLGEYTPPEKWPVGSTLDWLRQHLMGSFELQKAHDMPFLIRETARKYQWTVAQASVWRRTL